VPHLKRHSQARFQAPDRLMRGRRALRDTDLVEADLGTIVRNMISGQYSNALRVVAFNAAEGWSRDVSEDVAHEVLERAYDADTTLSAAAEPGFPCGPFCRKVSSMLRCYTSGDGASPVAPCVTQIPRLAPSDNGGAFSFAHSRLYFALAAAIEAAGLWSHKWRAER
jgi:hypothetical protein